MMETLENLSIECVCNNLNLNYHICIKNKWKIPSIISDRIFYKFFNETTFEKGRYLQFFDKEIMTLEKLELNKNSLENIELLENLDFESIKSVRVKKNCMNKKLSISLSSILDKCRKLEIICLKENSNMEKGFLNICHQLLKSTNTLKQINFSSCFPRSYCSKLIGELIKQCQYVENINFDNNSNVLPKINNFFKYLKNSSNNLKILSFSDCNLNENHSKDIENLLKISPFLENINFSRNSFNKESLLNVLNGIQNTHQSLKVLDLSHCNLSENLLLLMKRRNFKCMEALNISYNKNIGKGLSIILNDLISPSNSSLNELDCSICGINQNNIIEFGKILSKCSSIRTIKLNGNREMGNGFSNVCSGLLSSTKTLKNIYLSSCNLSKYQCKELGNLLKNCLNIEILMLEYNGNMETGFENICNGLKNSKQNLKIFSTHGCLLDSNQNIAKETLLNTKPQLKI